MTASTGRPEEADYLKGLGAAEMIARTDLTGPVRPLAKERWAGGIDTVGSTTLANVLAMTRYGGAVAACGLAGAWTCRQRLLRSFCGRLAFRNSIGHALKLVRKEAWKRLEKDLDRHKLSQMTAETGLAEIIEAGKK